MNKKLIVAIGIAFVFLAGVGVGSSFFGRSRPEPVVEKEAVGSVRQSEKTTILPFASTTPQSLPRPTEQSFGQARAGGEEEVRVTRVIDGDTIEVEMNGKTERVRYIGIDTPETVDPRKPVQCFGVEAAKKNKELVEGRAVRLEKDLTDRDKYNRLLRYVSQGDIFVNLALVAQGFAASYSYPPDIKYQDTFVAAERKAREDKLGLWTACAPPVTSATSATSSAASILISNPSCTIKGNVSASGEKIYHLQGCGSYAKTTIDESRGERWFCSEGEAQSAGWRKARNCP